MKIKDLKWEFIRRWWDVHVGKTENGFSFSDDGETLIIRNDFYEIGMAKSVFKLAPFSEYKFYVDTRTTDYERDPKGIEMHPNTPGGVCAAFQSAKGDELVEYVTSTKNNTSEWKTLSWTVRTNAGEDYTLCMCNGYYQAADKGTAYFKNLRWGKVADTKDEAIITSSGSKRTIKDILFSDGGVYSGEQIDDKPDGQGKLKLPIGISYEGTFKDGNFHGRGTMFMPGGAKYVGEFQDGKIHGQGTYTYPDGIIYEGSFVDGVRQGKGKSTTPDGMVDEGDMVNGKMHGKGKRIFPEGGYYQGDFLNGKPHGEGILIFPNGRTYEGKFENGKPLDKLP